jgi:hypothetical protein
MDNSRPYKFPDKLYNADEIATTIKYWTSSTYNIQKNLCTYVEVP